MLKAIAIFDASLDDARNLVALYEFLSQSVKAPYTFDDLLRSQVVYSVSAFDKLMHDLVRIGMVETFVGKRNPTDRFQIEPITLEHHTALVAATVPPKEYLFEQEIVKKLGYLTFQIPEKVSNGLSLIWNEPHKWTKIAGEMGWDPGDAKTKLKLIADRRNAIVHESDMHPLTNTKTPITVSESSDVTDFLQLCGQAIAKLVN